MSAGRLVGRGARPAARRPTSGLVEISLPPAPATAPSSTADEPRPPSARRDQVPPVPRRPAEVGQRRDPAPPRRDVVDRTAPAAGPPVEPDERLVQRRSAESPEVAPPLTPASASSERTLVREGAAPVPTPSADAPDVLPPDPVAGERPESALPAAEPTVERAPVVPRATLPPPSPGPAVREPVARTPAPTPVSAAPPPVVIERIEVVTPPARPVPVDPLASLAERRAGRSRHGAAR